MQDGDGYSSEQWDLIKAKIGRILAIYPPYPGAEVIYIDQVAGSDSTGDGSEELPYQTLTYAESVAAARATLLAWGTFNENVILDTVGLRLFGLGNGLSVIQGAADDTPKVTLDADSIEVALLGFNNGGFTGHGIWIDDSGHFNIHHNRIEAMTGVYQGIAKTALPINTVGKIEHNIVRDCAQAGIYLELIDKIKISKNICVRNTTEGIILLANAVNSDLIGNICNDNDEGIEILGNNNSMIDNIALGNATANLIDSGVGNIWKSPQRIPRWDLAGIPVIGIPVGLGVPLTLLSVNPTYPCNVALDIDISNYVAGDDVRITVEKRIDAINWRSVGTIVIVNGNVIDVIGTPYFVAAAIAAATIGGFAFLLYSDGPEQFRVIVNQTVGILRQLSAYYNIKREIS